MKKILQLKLWQQVLVGLFLGVVTGVLLKHYGQGDKAEDLKIFGTVFLSLIKMVIMPLIFFAILSGITSMHGDGNFTRVGLKGFSTYIFTAIFAVFIGITAGLVFQPGKGVELKTLIMQEKAKTVHTLGLSIEELEKREKIENELKAEACASTNKDLRKEYHCPPSAKEFFLNLIPTNPIKAMANDSFLQIIIFSIFTGIVINMIGEKGEPLRNVIFSASSVSFKMIELIIKLAPVGVFGYISWIVGTQGLDILTALTKLILTVLAACVIQYLIFGVMIMVFGKLSPLPFYRKILFTQSIAFSTSSSKATLSTALQQLQTRMGVSKTNSNFLLPLGVCINMDGTAIYLGICALFFSQALGIPLTASDYAMLILTCTFGSIGAAGIPSGSIIFMGMVLSSVGLPIEGIGIILGIDRVLDMVRTTINITGDSAITMIVDRTEGGLDEKVYYADN